MLRAIREIAPRYVVGENVLGLTNWNGGMVFDEVHSDLELAGYEVQAVVIPAAAVNAPHGRDRVWFVAKQILTDTDSNGQHRRKSEHEVNAGKGRINALGNIGTGGEHGFTSDTNSASSQRRNHKATEKRQKQRGRTEPLGKHTGWQEFPTQSPVCGRNDGLPAELDGIAFSKWRNESIKAYGNAVVPQVVYQIFKAIEEIDYLCHA
jgi:DNA (cytosine-5)-methyltransferase 1